MPFDNPEAEVELNDVTMRLIAGRQNIEKGWIKEHYQWGENYCALGAIGVSQEETDAHLSSCVGFLDRAIPTDKAVKLMFDNKEARIAVYNDASVRTKSEILDLFDRAIANSMNCG